MKYLIYVLLRLVILQIILAGAAFAVLPNKTPLEIKLFQSLPNSSEINHFFQELASDSPHARLMKLGLSAGKRDLVALLFSKDPAFLMSGKHSNNKLTVMLIGSLHGTEASGSEALQKLALELAAGKLDHYLEKMNLLVIANGNPDGRDNVSRFNQIGTNLNIDFMQLASPETLIYINVLEKYKPDALLDLHESAIEKKILAYKQGYLNETQAQYETGNNPNIDTNLLKLTHELLLPELIETSQAKGLPSQHYHGEIQQLEQPVAHGGLRISNLRNYSALLGSVSFLVENRLDPPNGKYPTSQNIKVRREKQYISAVSFLDVLERHHAKILSTVKSARSTWQTEQFSQSVVKLDFKYNLNKRKPWIVIPLLKISSHETVDKLFSNYDFVDIKETTKIPQDYAVTVAQEEISQLLKKHQIKFEVINRPRSVMAILPKVNSVHINYPRNEYLRTTLDVDAQYVVTTLMLKKGDLLVSTHQPYGLLVPLLLEVQSIDGLYQNANFRTLLLSDKVVPIFPVS